MRSLVFLAGLMGLSAFAGATPIAVNFKNAETPPNSTQVSLPFFASSESDTVFLRFKIPGIGTVGTINTFDITVSLYDDGDRGGETGVIQFALPNGPNLTLGNFGPNLNGFTAGSPDVFTFDLTPDQIAQVFPSIEDGNFRIRIQRNSGSYYVAGGTASIDANLVPEPASLIPAGIGLLLVAVGLHRRRK